MTHSKSSLHEVHRSRRIGWLRAAVLGADDGVVSTSALLIGVTAASASHAQVLTAGLAGLIAGAASMAAGEYVSVSSQLDAERADIAAETRELQANPRGELSELADIYRARGLDAALAMTVAKQLSAHDQLQSHLRDELGIDPGALARPAQAAGFSAASFALAGALPLLSFALAPPPGAVIAVVVPALASLALFGSLGAYLGGASMLRGALRVLLGGGLAMAATALVGHFVRFAS